MHFFFPCLYLKSVPSILTFSLAIATATSIFYWDAKVPGIKSQVCFRTISGLKNPASWYIFLFCFSLLRSRVRCCCCCCLVVGFFSSLEIILYAATQDLSVVHLKAFHWLSGTSSEIKWGERMKWSRQDKRFNLILRVKNTRAGKSHLFMLLQRCKSMSILVEQAQCWNPLTGSAISSATSGRDAGLKTAHSALYVSYYINFCFNASSSYTRFASAINKYLNNENYLFYENFRHFLVSVLFS